LAILVNAKQISPSNPRFTISKTSQLAQIRAFRSQ
jgi:hypothetical protein